MTYIPVEANRPGVIPSFHLVGRVWDVAWIGTYDDMSELIMISQLWPDTSLAAVLPYFIKANIPAIMMIAFSRARIS
jgi:hypothetical protein